MKAPESFREQLSRVRPTLVRGIPRTRFETQIIGALTQGTMGKALLGLRVVKKDYGTMPEFGVAASRVFQLWFRAMWGGLPLVSLVGMAFAAHWLRRDGETGYDRSLGTRVEALPLTAGRIVAAGATAVVLLVLLGITTAAFK